MKEQSLSDKILNLRRYLSDNGSMIYWQGDNDRNRGIYVDLGAVMGNLKQAIQRLKDKIKPTAAYFGDEIIKEIEEIFGDKLTKGERK